MRVSGSRDLPLQLPNSLAATTLGNMPKPSEALDPYATFIYLEREGGARALDVDAEFWSRLSSDASLTRGRLLGLTETGSSGSSHWECHPKGDELLLLLGGSLDVVLVDDAGERTVSLRDHQAMVVPKGVWHRQVYRRAGTLLFVTAGDDTEHRPYTPNAKFKP